MVVVSFMTAAPFSLGAPSWAASHACNEHLRRDPALADLPIIVVSGIDAEPLARHFAGIVAHFAKPIAVPDLLAAIRKHCPPK